MTDISLLKDSIDLREWVEKDLGQSPKRRGHGDKAWNFRCPFHSEQKGASLAVYQKFWKCFGACGASGDIFDWVAKREGLELNRGEDFQTIIKMLGGDPDAPWSKPTKRPTPPLPPPPVLGLPPNEHWQSIATEIVEQAERRLWSLGGREALHYLIHRRGLHEQTIRDARLGYIPDDGHRPRIEMGMKTPSPSITIPWFVGNALWGVKCRLLSSGDLRYLFLTADDDHQEHLGSANISSSLYWADHIAPRMPILIVEGEFNCLSIWEAARDVVCPVSLGASGQELNVRWFSSLITAPVILTWFDADRAGQGGTKRLTALASYLQPVTLPNGVGKDINDFWRLSQQQKRPEAVKNWLVESLARQKEGK